MTAYLSAGAEVTVHHQREVNEAGQFAIEVRDTDCWIDCCDTKEDAVVLAKSLGLRVDG